MREDDVERMIDMTTEALQRKKEQAISFVMKFYQVSREDACELYQDEIKAYMWLNDEDDESDV